MSEQNEISENVSDTEQNAMEVEDENSSSSCSNSGSSQESEQELIVRAEHLEREISSNKFLYDAHVEIVDIYRKLKDMKSFREAYQRFHKCYPMTPKLWMDWINYEMKVAKTFKELDSISKLYDHAVEDYLSAKLWVEYTQYSLGVFKEDKTRAIIERGLSVVGLHASEGSLLWDTFREIEHAYVGTHSEGSEAWKAQVNRLNNVFKRQLSVPLLGMESTYCEWQNWCKSIPEDIYDKEQVEWAYKKALKTLQVYEPFENRLLIEGVDKYQVYKKYLDVVEDPSTKICLYERAIESLCLVPEVWLDYCSYIFKLGETADKVSIRSLRNCPWSEDLWLMRLRILEYEGADENKILSCFEEGISSLSPNPSLELWASYLEYMNRNVKDTDKLDKTFDQAILQLNEVDISYKLSRWHAMILAKRGDMKGSRRIWNNILADPNNKELASVWLEYAALERQFGDAAHVRSVFKKSLSVCTSWCQSLADEWLMYERVFGTLQDVMKCTETCKRIIQTELPNAEVHNTENISGHAEEKSKKRKFEQDRKSLPKRGKFQKLTAKTEEIPPIAQKHIERDPKTTVFLSNLHFSLTAEKIQELFPNAKDIEIIMDKWGKSRCFGFMQFNKEEETLAALARDRIPIDGRPIFISEVKLPRSESKPVFKYASTVETNKLFVRGLPITKTKEDVIELFKLFSPVDVRLVTKRNGESKGLAFVEFADEEAAQKALKVTDQMIVENNVITVAISAPPPKQNRPDKQTIGEPIRQARSRLQVPLLPRTLQVKNGDKAVTETGGQSNNKGPAKSNADFRNMLLKK